MNSNDDFQENLVKLLTLFKDRPYHLVKYLTEHSAFNKTFINKIAKSEKLNQIGLSNNDVYLSDISQMDDFYNSFLDNLKTSSKNIEELTIELNMKLDELIRTEKFEEAAKLRDYMLKKSIKRNKE